MDWIIDHLQALFVVAIAIVAILQKLKAQSGGGSDEASPGDAGEGERTRRLQEEIRRKIMERRGLAPEKPAGASFPAEPQPAFPRSPPMIEEMRPVFVELPPEQAAPVPDESESLARQQELLDRLLAYQTKRRAQSSGAPTETSGDTGRAFSPPPAAAGSWIAELRKPAGLRRAVVLREILGPPVGLR